ncbi:MAG TPA: restriction endonuclease [Kofleriaceae bacterium]|nr:restriction endonuclease [Kofleriaceae bacterium]
MKAQITDSLRAKLATAHHLDGATMVAPDGLPAIAFQLSHGVHEYPTPGENAKAIVIAAGHEVYPCVAMLVVTSASAPLVARLDLHSTEVTALLARRQAHFLMFRRQRLVSSGTYEWLAEHKMFEHLAQLRREHPLPAPAFFRWHLLRLPILAPLLTQTDRAAAGWMESWDAMLSDARGKLEHVKAMLKAAPFADEPLSEPYDRIVDVLRAQADPLRDIIPIVITEVERDAGARLLRRIESQIGKALQVVLVPLAAESPPATQSGRAFSAIRWRSPNFEFVPVPLDLDAIEKTVGLAEFWTRLPTGGRLHWDRFVRGDDIPAAGDVLEDGFRAAALVDDAEEARATASALLGEATLDRQWTIPPRAVVDFRLGPFVRAEVFDFTSHVVFMCRTPRWHYHPIVLDIRSGQVMEGLSSLFAETDAARADQLEATVYILLASIVRDFLVVEDRSAVFGSVKEARHRSVQNGGTATEPVVVYLPRVRYGDRPDVARLARDIPIERRAHDVSAHLRRSRHMSPTQRALAEYHGWTIPDGFTFVRPHRRGIHEVEVIYRSRSALHALYEIVERDASAEPPPSDHWFEFEQNVRAVVRARGLRYEEVQQLGDTGIAVLAVDDRDAGHGLWLVHAIAGRRVGPGLVERHASALGQAPAGTRGLLVAMGALTSAARATADGAGIVVVEHVAPE